MRFFRRSLIALGVAAMLPTLVLAAIGTVYFLRAERAQVEAATLERSANVATLGDTALRGHVGALHVLATSAYFETLSWSEFYPRVSRYLRGTPAWSTLILYDVDLQAQIFDLRRPFTLSPLAAPLPGTLSADALRDRTDVAVGGVVIDGEPVIHLYHPIRKEGRLRYVLIAAVRTQIFQEILLTQVPPDTIAATVDRAGNFVARSREYEQRVGTPATQFVRDAIQGGSRGFYRGRTYEGFENYSAFQTSPWSGLSTHIAVASSLIDRPTSWAFLVTGIAGLAALALASVLVLLVLRDMAERRRAEETLRQSQKMEAVGQLTGGIAHDFNNLLTAVIGNLDMLRTRTQDNERLRMLADNALEAAQRGAKLTSQLLAFSRSQRMHLETIDLELLVKGMSSLLQQSAGTDIAVRIEIDPAARMVCSDPNQLELALINLAVNARDAMPRGGSLRISTHVALPMYQKDLPKRDYVEIRVSDTGEGMPEEVRRRAIEPFFTTKQVGQGTGLGLSQVYAVTRESAGTLHIDSEPGEGTTIRLILPAADGDSVPVSAREQTAQTVPHNPSPAAAILVVDDDRQVRRFVAESLRASGYRVSDVDRGSAALEQLKRERFDLLVVDFAMPGMNGAEVAHAARAISPELRILLVSGYADSSAIEAALGSTPVLRKPFDVAELRDAIARVLR